MSKKHFIALADTIRLHNKWSNWKFEEQHLDVLADFLKSQNPRFDRSLWLDYIDGKCGPSGGTIKSQPKEALASR